MKLITRDTDYAIRAISYMAKHGDKTIPVNELVKSLNIPQPFLRKILQILNQKGLLRSHKGKGGGFKLSRKPADISIADLIKIFQGPVRLSEHIFKKKPCPNVKTCILKKKLDNLEKKLFSELNSLNIKDIL